jgi:hypothetical protein
MKYVSFAVTLLTLTVMLFGCAEERIQGQTTKEIYSSYVDVRNSLPEDKREEFRKDVVRLIIDVESLEDIGGLLGGLASVEGDTFKEKGMRAALDMSDNLDRIKGKNAEQIFRAADSIEVEKLEKEISSLEDEIESIRKDKKLAEVSKEELKKLKVNDDRLIESGNRFIDRNEFYVEVKNELKESIRIIRLKCNYYNEKQGVTYAEGDIKFELSSNLQSGEMTGFLGRFNTMSNFSDVTIYESADLSCEAVTVWGPSSNEPIYDSSFSKDDREELEEKEENINQKKERLKELQQMLSR